MRLLGAPHGEVRPPSQSMEEKMRINRKVRRTIAGLAALAVSVGPIAPAMADPAGQDAATSTLANARALAAPVFPTTTPIKHLVVIFQENISFDHYFGTYPNAENTKGEPAFFAAPGTPTVNGLAGALLNSNPNSLNAGNLSGATNPFRLDRSQAATADQGHNYGPEQAAVHFGLMDLFPLKVGAAGPPPNA